MSRVGYYQIDSDTTSFPYFFLNPLKQIQDSVRTYLLDQALGSFSFSNLEKETLRHIAAQGQVHPSDYEGMTFTPFERKALDMLFSNIESRMKFLIPNLTSRLTIHASLVPVIPGEDVDFLTRYGLNLPRYLVLFGPDSRRGLFSAQVYSGEFVPPRSLLSTILATYDTSPLIRGLRKLAGRS